MTMKKKIIPNLEKVCLNLLHSLEKRERFVLEKRFGLKNEKKATLESIGKKLSLTRERVRQIQNLSLKKIKSELEQSDKGTSKILKNLFDISGGILSPSVIKKIIPEENKILFNQIGFILAVGPNLTSLKGNKSREEIFADFKISASEINALKRKIEKIIKKRNGSTTKEKFYQELKKDKTAQKLKKNFNQTLAVSLALTLRQVALSKKGRIGFISSPLINPRSARDKAYFVLKYEKTPLHFVKIAEKIAGLGFAKKAPTAATVHNELILDKRFVLIGRGIYALTEWGYKEGTVEKVIEQILADNPKGLEKNKIVETVLKKRLVARNTVIMNLMLKKKFKKVGKEKYRLVKKS